MFGTSRLLRSCVDSLASCASTSGIFVETCLFCSHATKSAGKSKSSEQIGQCEYNLGAKNIKEAAKTLKDEPMFVKLG